MILTVPVRNVRETSNEFTTTLFQETLACNNLRKSLTSTSGNRLHIKRKRKHPSSATAVQSTDKSTPPQISLTSQQFTKSNQSRSRATRGLMSEPVESKANANGLMCIRSHSKHNLNGARTLYRQKRRLPPPTPDTGCNDMLCYCVVPIQPWGASSNVRGASDPAYCLKLPWSIE